jgi:acetyl esterase
MPIDESIASQLRALGPGATLPEVQALYTQAHAAQDRVGVSVSLDCVYGPHERHRVDIYAPSGTKASGRPLLVWLHGGGFIRGDKSARSHIGWWGARQGWCVALPNYRLAPESRWPCGPEDVVHLWCWLQAEAGRRGFDPRCIVLAGESAGAAHVAAAVLMRRFQPKGWAPAGAVLMSGPYHARLEGLARNTFGITTPDPRNDAYFGSDSGDLYAASIVEQVDADPLPLLISYAERDLLQMQVQAGELFARLVTQHGFEPELHVIREHNHFSGGFSIGTPDDSVSGLLAQFVQRCCDPARSERN